MSAAPHTDAVPLRYRGVWRRSLLEARDLYDVTTTVFWMQTQCWHTDLRIPVSRPDFSGVRSLAECSHTQLQWLARQQGFAGVTEVDRAPQPEICRWHRMLDYQPPRLTPDAGYMRFDPTRLVETGVHRVYMEHWHRQENSTEGFAVLQRLDDRDAAAVPRQFLMLAGDYVMHVRERRASWPPGMPRGFDMRQLDDAALRELLDFEISFGVRTANGWQVMHSSLPWLENRCIAMQVENGGSDIIGLAQDGVWTSWRVLEWQPPA